MNDDNEQTKELINNKAANDSLADGEQPEEKKLTLKKVIPTILFVLVAAVFIFAAVKAILPGPQEKIAVVIPDGSSVNDISQILYQRDIIQNTWIFKFYVFAGGKTEKLLPGRYVLKRNSAYRAVVKDLVAGPKKDFYNLTIPEGFTLKQIGERLSRNGGLSFKEFNILTGDTKLYKYDFLKYNTSGNLEGYLFPETYRLDAQTQISDLINMMLKQFESEYQSIKQRKMPIKLSLHQIVTIASLVEREAKLKEEQPIIAGVIYNRLKKNMKLEVDASVQYALTKWKKQLSYKDLKIDSPYNTYKYAGLPPSPIANPGQNALQAALKPANVRYLYYVLIDEKTGKHFFTDNYQEFLKAKKKKAR